MADSTSAFHDLCRMAEGVLDYAPRCASRDRFLETPELVLMAFDYLTDNEIIRAAEAGRPFYTTVRGSGKLVKQFFLEYDRSAQVFAPNPFFFGFLGTRSIDTREEPPRHIYGQTRFLGEKRHRLPDFDISYSTTAPSLRLCFSEPENIKDVFKRRGLFMDMRLGSPAECLKIVVENTESRPFSANSWDHERAPKAPLWATAELTVDIQDMRMYSIFRIAQGLYEYASTMDLRTEEGKGTMVDQGMGEVSNPTWRSFFKREDLEAVRGDGPTCTWIQKRGSSDG